MDSLFKDVYSGASVFVTGHTGFKGAWLSLWLAELGANVTGFALAPDTDPSLFEAAEVAERITSIEGDIRDREALKQAVQEAKPSVVLHLAAQALVQRSYQDPIETYESNVMGTAHLLEAVRACESVRACVVVTSDKCYENLEQPEGYRESDPMGGYDPYSASKGCSELVTSSYRRSFFHPDEYGTKHHVALASARAGNVIGGGDWAANRIVPDFVRALSTGEKLILRNPGAVRPWQHVLEPLSGYLWLAAKLLSEGVAFAEGWNFGPKESAPLTVEQLVRQAVEVLGEGSYDVQSDGHPHEAHLLQLNIDKAKERLNWVPVFTAEETIESTLAWYRRYYDGVRGKDLQVQCIDEIASYASRMMYAR